MADAAPSDDPPVPARDWAPARFADPLGFIAAEHERQGVVCARLTQLAERMEGDAIARDARAIIRFLSEDLAWHAEDEEQDLFPILRKRCVPADHLDRILEHLSFDHELDKDLVEFILADLQPLAEGHPPVNPVRLLMNIGAFAETQVRHLDWENRHLMPLAAQRLEREDRQALGLAMARRRGIGRGGTA